MARNLKLRDRPLDPNLQVSFFHKLKAIKRLYLHEALRVALKSLQLEVVDSELKAYVSPSALKTVAQFGLRGETIFPVPSLLRSNPFLLGYYRLLYGLSQKEFYSKGPFGRFKRMEKDGHLSAGAEQSIDDLCHSLVSTSV
ncbi:MAG: XcyI family restriction endonuclease, partial [Dehalococcoidales bacterium]